MNHSQPELICMDTHVLTIGIAAVDAGIRLGTMPTSIRRNSGAKGLHKSCLHLKPLAGVQVLTTYQRSTMSKYHHALFDVNPALQGLTAKPAQFGRVMPWVLAALLVAGAGGLWWWKIHIANPDNGTATPAANAPAGGAGMRRFGGVNNVQPVSVQLVHQQDIRVTVNAIGSIVAFNTATVHAQVSGVLQRLEFKEGQQVKAGQLLAQIDPRAFQATLGQV